MYINKIAPLSCFLIFIALSFSGNDRFGINYCQAVRANSRSKTKKGLRKSDAVKSERDNDNLGFVDGFVRVNIFGNLHEFAFYYAYIGMGNPKVKQMLIIDTGSQLVNVSCGRCPECGKHMLKNYYYEESITHRPISCDDEKCKVIEGSCNMDKSCAFNETYSEGSTVEGRFIGDLITFDTTKDSSDLSTFFDYIGCISKESDLIKTQITNGILGLSRSDKPTLVNHEYFETQSFIEKYLTDHFRPMKKIFSLCLSDNGGVLTMGGHDKDLDLMMNKMYNVMWTPMIESEFYVIRIYSMKIKSERLDFSVKNFVLDTGTTISTFESGLFKQIHTQYKKICEENTKLANSHRAVGKCTVDDKTNNICFTDISKLPPIVMIFENGSKFEWTAESFMIDRSNKKTVNDYNWWCMGIEESKTKENILGASFFKNNHVIFDLNDEKIGLSIGKCPEMKH